MKDCGQDAVNNRGVLEVVHFCGGKGHSEGSMAKSLSAVRFGEAGKDSVRREKLVRTSIRPPDLVKGRVRPRDYGLGRL
jgi:hypothetical protein